MRKLVQPVILVAATASLAIAQQAPPQTQVKSGKGVTKQEAEAYNAITKAQTPDERMKAADEFVTKFADSQFKGLALNMAAQAADQKGDYQKAIIYGDEALQSDPSLFEAKLLVAGEIAQHTGQNDLDKDEKLSKAEKYVNEALETMPNAPKPQPTVKDADWDAYKKYETARAHLDLGLIAQARKKADQQVAEFKMAAEMMDPPDPVVLLRLAIAYDDAGKTDDGLQVLNKLLAMPDLNPRVKDIATQEKARAEKAKK
jgi:tetratricopeptide (TPR) repeat protein